MTMEQAAIEMFNSLAEAVASAWRLRAAGDHEGAARLASTVCAAHVGDLRASQDVIAEAITLAQELAGFEGQRETRH